MAEHADKLNGGSPGSATASPASDNTTGGASAPQVSPGPPKRVPLPTGPGTKWRMWVWLFLSVLLCLPPLLIELGTPATKYTMEQIALLSSRETWNRQASGDAEAWLVPTWNGQPRVNKPPLVVWLNMLAWSDLNPKTVNPDLLIWRARLLAVGMVMLALVGTYWLAYSIGGVRVAAMSTLVVGTTYMLMRFGRLATYDIHLFAWTTLSVAAGLWAMRPLRPISWTGRRVIGWLLAGIALGAGIMTKGPIAAFFVAIPLMGAIIVCPQRRVGNALGLLFALLAGALLAAPWYMYIIQKLPDAFKAMEYEYEAHRNQRQSTFYYLLMFGYVFPWTVVLICSLFQPFVRAKGEHRRRLLLGWLWFIAMMVLMAIPDAKQDRYMLPVLPAMAVMVAQLWAYHAFLAEENLPDPGVNFLRIPHWVMLAIASIVLPLFVIFQDQLIVRGYLKQIELPGIPMSAAIGVGAALLVIVIFGAIQHWRWKPVHAFAATAVWMLVTSTFVQASYTHSYHGRYDYIGDARNLAAVTDGQPVFCFYDPAQGAAGSAGAANCVPDENFTFYAGVQFHVIQADQLSALAQKPCFVMLRLDARDTHADQFKADGFVKVLDFSDGQVVPGINTDRCRLYRSPAVK